MFGPGALASYPVDWIQDKVIGGGLKMAQGATDYMSNEASHQQYPRSLQEYIPEDVEQMNYTVNKLQATGKMVEGLADQAEGYTALQGLLMGGLEGTVTQGAKSAATKRFNNMIENMVTNPQGSADDILSNFSEAGYKASVKDLRTGRGQQITIEGFPGINTIKVHGGGGRHGLARIEISGSKGVYKIVQGSAENYKGNIQEEMKANTRFIFTQTSK
ncbi:MAG TPA: hypothetical protein VK658_09100 [Chryseolinea sp.]|nr:hypothetical protein [Chryseolinea sp.]